MVYTGTDFAHDISLAMQKAGDDARGLTADAVRRACSSPTLLDGYEDEMAAHLEFHLLQTPEAAIKVFALKPEHGLGVAHDHAGLWGCYASHHGSYWMETYRLVGPDGTDLEVIDCRLMEAGEIRFMEPDAVHRIWSEEPSAVLTVYNGDLNSLPRRIFNREDGRIIEAQSRWEERIVDGEVNFDLEDERIAKR
jgi:predicted metal-dependent enzyme (double-stranded beta helix superfamily)